MRGHAIHDDTYNAYPFTSAVAVSRDNRSALCLLPSPHRLSTLGAVEWWLCPLLHPGRLITDIQEEQIRSPASWWVTPWPKQVRTWVTKIRRRLRYVVCTFLESLANANSHSGRGCHLVQVRHTTKTWTGGDYFCYTLSMLYCILCCACPRVLYTPRTHAVNVMQHLLGVVTIAYSQW